MEVRWEGEVLLEVPREREVLVEVEVEVLGEVQEV